jgi:hypothetical protein
MTTSCFGRALSDLLSVSHGVPSTIAPSNKGSSLTAATDTSDGRWAAFLAARKEALDWLHAQGKADSQIANELSITAAEVYYLRTHGSRPNIGDLYT